MGVFVATSDSNRSLACHFCRSRRHHAIWGNRHESGDISEGFRTCHAFYFVLYNVLLFWFICWVDWGSTMRHFWESRSKNAPSQSQYAISIKISSSSRTARVLLCIGCLVVVVSLCVTFYGLHAHFGPVILLYVLCVAWATDTGAYFVGRAFGKRRLARRISPKKTIEGTIGGCLLGLIVALIPGFLWIQPNLGWSNFGVITVACVLPFLSVFGDLLESVLKRISDAKDSGSILPGHGGLLDRIDSLVVATPFMFVISIVLGITHRRDLSSRISSSPS